MPRPTLSPPLHRLCALAFSWPTIKLQLASNHSLNTPLPNLVSTREIKALLCDFRHHLWDTHDPHFLRLNDFTLIPRAQTRRGRARFFFHELRTLSAFGHRTERNVWFMSMEYKRCKCGKI
ncbi:hypothetical protein BDR07DRAFT_1422780 [Suillus spraguei]|nr:hypothetical protein BDR07DRAFT_1444809 [Suillus spraguei]KAG2356620.1 hypothetical protein BDR07DRAFT_1422780 [Suillus spraguei]